MDTQALNQAMEISLKITLKTQLYVYGVGKLLTWVQIPATPFPNCVIWARCLSSVDSVTPYVIGNTNQCVQNVWPFSKYLLMHPVCQTLTVYDPVRLWSHSEFSSSTGSQAWSST